MPTVAVINGPCVGGGYELALACNHIMLTDDSTSAVGLPEVPLLAVLPGTGGLTRVTDKRKSMWYAAFAIAALLTVVGGLILLRVDETEGARAAASRSPAVGRARLRGTGPAVA